jgi:calcineurin-like phosphoesterase family protein
MLYGAWKNMTLNIDKQNKNNIWFTSDTHYFHHNIIKYSNRPFNNIEEMRDVLVEKWNSVVQKDDIVFHLGDVAMGGKKRASELRDILFSLNGTINLIKGNHDNYVLDSPCRERFNWIKDYFELSYGHKKIILQHFPLLTWNNAGKTDDKNQPASFHLHGHSHSGIDHINATTTRMDVGVDSQNYEPRSIESIIDEMNCRVFKSIDHHGNKTTYY